MRRSGPYIAGSGAVARPRPRPWSRGSGCSGFEGLGAFLLFPFLELGALGRERREKKRRGRRHAQKLPLFSKTLARSREARQPDDILIKRAIDNAALVAPAMHANLSAVLSRSTMS